MKILTGGYEMAITPDERRDIQLKELDRVADYLESLIDRKLIQPSMPHADTTTVFIEPSDFYIGALLKTPSMMENLKQRYIEKGWKNVEFRQGGGNYESRYLTVELIPPGVITGYTVKQYLVKVILGFVGLLLLGLLIKSC